MMRRLKKTAHLTEFKRKPKTGFALVTALMLMAFVLTLILAFSLTVNVNTRSSQIQLNKEKAKANAMLALQIALGELQKAAGPDQRVTARADIQDTILSSAEQEIAFTSVANPYLTLVYDVSGAEALPSPGEIVDGADFRPQHDPSKKPAVLISGNEGLSFDLTATGGNYPTDYVTPDSSISADPKDSVQLVSAPANTETPLQASVRAPYVEIDRDDQTAGRYAWWVGDEGIKARININYESERSSGSADADATWKTPHRFRPEGWDADLATVNANNWIRLLDNQSLPLSASSWDNAKPPSEYFHDLTYHSSSLLVDVRRSGFKKDLSYALGNTNGTNALPNEQFIFPRDLEVEGARAQVNHNVNIAYPQWGVLRDFYQFSEAHHSDASIPMRNHRYETDTLLVPSSLPIVTGSGANFKNGFTPVLTLYQVGYGAYLPPGIDPNDDNEQIQLELQVMPSVVLWNPYNFDLEVPELVLTQTISGGGDGILRWFIFYEDAVSGIIKPGNPNNGPRHGMRTHIGPLSVTTPAAIIPAGQAMVFSAPVGKHTLQLGKHDPWNRPGGSRTYADLSQSNKLQAGYRPYTAFTLQADRFNVYTSDYMGPMTIPEGSRIQMLTDGGEGYDISMGEAASNHDYLSQRPNMMTAINVDYDPFVAFGNQLFSASDPNPTPRHLYTMYRPVTHDPLDLTTPFPVALASQLNPRSMVNDAPYPVTEGQGEPTGYLNQVPTYVGGFFSDADAQDQHEVLTSNYTPGGLTYLGNQSTKVTKHVLYELPENGFFSLAQLSSSNITAPPPSVLYYRLWSGTGGDYAAPAYPIGSSNPNPYIQDLNLFTETLEGYVRPNVYRPSQQWDYSYLLNEALYDRYFFSTIPQSGSLDANILTGDTSLRNPLLSVENAPSEAELRNFDSAAEHLKLTGGFNVNSTSVQAWMSFLSAFKDVNYDATSDTGTLFARLDKPSGALIKDTELNMESAASYTGHRRLSDDPLIRDLAEKIVAQVKVRGPFPSLSAFVNRTIDGNKLWRDSSTLSATAPTPKNIPSMPFATQVQLKGALQTALELSEANAPFYVDSEFIIDKDELSDPAPQPIQAFESAIASGLPGFLSQYDLMNRLGPAMTVRSDTFTIRAAGQHLSPISGKPISTAYIEAVVQRRPEYVDPSNPVDTTVFDSSLTASNAQMGRRFQIISMRWLDEDEL